MSSNPTAAANHPSDRRWWNSEGRCEDWPDELKDTIHREFQTGYQLGLTSLAGASDKKAPTE